MSQSVVIGIVLLAAVLHASWNVIVKQSGDRLLTFATVIGMGGLLALPLTLVVPAPRVECHLHLATSALVHLVYYAFLLLGYRYGDLGQVYPIARGSGPLLVALAAGPLAGEPLHPWGGVGVVMVSGGIIALAGRGGRPKAVGFALATGVCIAAYSTADGLGVRVAGHPLAYIVWLHVVIGVPFGVAVYWLRRRRLARFLATDGARAAVGGVIGALAYSLVIWAMGSARLSYVTSLRETSVILAAVLGSALLGEPFGRRRVIASVVVTGGIVLMSVNS